MRPAFRWAVSLVGVLLLAALLWYFAPLWPPLEPPLARIIAVQTLLVAWAVANAALDWRRRRRDAALATGLSAGEERTAINQAFADAVGKLRRKGALLDLPWYAIIGPPGAGKTTALHNAGLRFIDQQGRVPGVGGTRLCDWWFTEDAVLIDTAGRYTTQDSDAQVDRAGWDAFLALLKRTRPLQPLNGVLVAIGLPDLVQAPQPERDAHAAAIARRIEELERRLGLRMPVYALFTKADLVTGFTEFFDDLDRDGRDQVWGETFAFDAAKPLPLESVALALRGLAARLGERMLPRLAAERRAERRGPIAGFPTQFASLERPLATFAAAAFPPSTLLRGVYFASGTQEGTPIDRLTGAMARAFGIGASRAAALRPEAGRSYFLGRLLRGVIFGEAALIRHKPGAARRRTLLRAAGFAVLLLALGATAATLLLADRSTGTQLAAAAQRLGAYEQADTPLATDPVENADLPPLNAALDAAAGLATSVSAATAQDAAFGLGQGGKLAAAAQLAYRNALVYGLLPRIAWQLEAEMRGQLRQPGPLYDTTRLYLMLGAAGPLDPAALRAHMAADWSLAAPDDPDLVASLLAHLDHLVAEPLPPIPLDGPLVEAARAGFGSVPVPDRIFANLQGATASLPPWRPIDSLGSAGVPLFARASGRPMTDGVPGLFTAAGFRDVLAPSLASAARQVAAETWVTGRKADYTPAELQALQQAVLALYFGEFTRRWDAILTDLDIAPMASIPQAAQNLYLLASPESPLRNLLRAVAAQLSLPGSPPAAARYAALVALTSGDGATLDRLLRLVADVQQPFAKIAALPVGTAAPPGGEDIGNALQADAVRQPAPLNRWLATIAATATALRTGNVKQRITLAFNAPGGPAQACPAATAQYPFASSGPPLPIAEFARVFGPGGVIDGFFNTQLKPFVDTTAKPWKPQPGGPLSQADILQYQRAAAIRDAFFPANQPNPSLQIELSPLATSAPATLDYAGATIETGRPQAHAAQLAWPGPPADATLTPDPPNAALHETGPWSLIRLLARARLQPIPRTPRTALAFGPVAFELRTSPAPFAPSLFTDFHCPAAP